ncbi:MAG: hypothetical protein QOJ50_3391, partial [Cryptosporangiaceae bacterium]|nr:hypothetical protein [Cryptosporangiaceae bacterium]MDQ1647207.1 hypothetical protein [Cryptosporangiaceae bacterium]
MIETFTDGSYETAFTLVRTDSGRGRIPSG